MRKNFCTVGLIYFILHRSPPRLKDRRRRGRRSSIAPCPAPVDVGLMWRRYNCLDPLAIVAHIYVHRGRPYLPLLRFRRFAELMAVTGSSLPAAAYLCASP
jgi:hypothetical protein